MKISKKLTGLLVILLLSILGCSLTYQWAVKGCLSWECAPERSFDTEEIQVPNEYFPEGADIGNLVKDRGILYADEFYQSVRWEGGRSFFIVMKFVSDKQASVLFEKEKGIDQFPTPVNSSDSVDQILSFKNSGASQYFTECGYDLEDLVCVHGAQYDEYYVYFKSTIDSKMLVENYLAILKYLDQKIISLLDD